jgi:hypothetical protein
MAALSDAERKALWAQFMSDASAENQVLPLLKTDLRAAVDAIDDWIDNTALPQPAKDALTAKQKAQLIMYVVRKRFEVT